MRLRAAAVALAAFGVAETFLGDYTPAWAWVLAACACGAALLACRRRPLAALAAVVAVAVVSRAVVESRDTPLFPFLAVLGACFATGAYSEVRTTFVAVTLAVIVYAVGAVAGDQPAVDIAFVALMLAGAGALGRVVAERRERMRLLAAETRAREAVLEERARIARELHDVVAHSMSMIVLQVGAVRRHLTPEQDREREVLRGVEAGGRQALAEMRRLVGIQRRAEADAPLAPQPSLARIDELVASVREVGLDVELRVEGPVGPLPPGLDLSAYRIVQEALTNTIKHAGPAHATVLVRYGERALELEVADDGRGGRANGDGSGNGLIGMRERAALFGGEVSAGGRAGGGWCVRARLPVRSDG
jgi:signal transduction histidine kinase